MSGVDAETAEKFKKQGNVDVLELMDIGHLTRCEHCNEQQLPGTIYCLCGKQVPNLQLVCEQKSQGDTQTVVKELLQLKEIYWRTGMARGIKGGGAGESQNRYNARRHHKRSTDGVRGTDGIRIVYTGCTDRWHRYVLMPPAKRRERHRTNSETPRTRRRSTTTTHTLGARRVISLGAISTGC